MVLGFPLRLCPICHLSPSTTPSGSLSVLVSSFNNAELDWFSVPEYAFCASDCQLVFAPANIKKIVVISEASLCCRCIKHYRLNLDYVLAVL